MDEKACVFAVDDDALVLRSLCALLGAHGFEVHGFNSAEAFLAAADFDSVGCVITDLRMPGMNGEQLQAHLADVGSSLAVVVVTGHADEPTAMDLIDNGAVTVLDKPYTCAALLSAVESAIEYSRRRHAIQFEGNGC
ncbi:MAG TPA: response regulator [Phycisphaerae bacterium]|mgnify:CR=1 FL=1|nr:response regulator [Phycisphaerae bacterium]HRW54780.1 response regulator [Phycisphaerae bacterium]